MGNSVWSDEFNGTSLDTAKWKANNNCPPVYLACDTDRQENVYVSDNRHGHAASANASRAIRRHQQLDGQRQSVRSAVDLHPGQLPAEGLHRRQGREHHELHLRPIRVARQTATRARDVLRVLDAAAELALRQGRGRRGDRHRRRGQHRQGRWVAGEYGIDAQLPGPGWGTTRAPPCRPHGTALHEPVHAVPLGTMPLVCSLVGRCQGLRVTVRASSMTAHRGPGRVVPPVHGRVGHSLNPVLCRRPAGWAFALGRHHAGPDCAEQLDWFSQPAGSEQPVDNLFAPFDAPFVVGINNTVAQPGRSGDLAGPLSSNGFVREVPDSRHGLVLRSAYPVRGGVDLDEGLGECRVVRRRRACRPRSGAAPSDPDVGCETSAGLVVLQPDRGHPENVSRADVVDDFLRERNARPASDLAGFQCAHGLGGLHLSVLPPMQGSAGRARRPAHRRRAPVASSVGRRSPWRRRSPGGTRLGPRRWGRRTAGS